MRRIHPTLIATACSLALSGAALAQTSGTITTAAGTTVSSTSSSGATGTYLKRADARFGSFTGSSANTESLAGGLRTGSEITLTGNGETASFTSPTKPMGYGEITRSLDLAQRQLAAAGISDPTPTEIQAALMGGTVTGPNGPVTFDGVLQLRSQGMGWGQIAHTIGVHPGLGKAPTTPVPAHSAASTGISAAGSKSGVVTAGAKSGVVTAGAKSGVVTAAGGSSVSHGNGRALGLTTSGATSAAGASNAGGLGGTTGRGNAFGRAGK